MKIMATTLEILKEGIAHLEKEDPEGKLVTSLRMQLQGLEDAPETSAFETWHSGNPVVPASRTRPSASDPMLPAMNGLERALRRKDAQVMARHAQEQAKAPGSTTAKPNGKP